MERLVLSPWVVPFLWKPSPHADCKGLTSDPDAAKLPYSAASLLYPHRVARISPLIGKSDTTVNRDRWQVYFSGTPARPDPIVPGRFIWEFRVRNCTNAGAQKQKRHPQMRMASSVLRWSLASQILRWTVIFPPLLLQTVPAGHSLFRAALFADALAGRLLSFGLAGLYSSSRYITGTLVVAIQLPFVVSFGFNSLPGCRLLNFLHSWSISRFRFQKS